MSDDITVKYDEKKARRELYELFAKIDNPDDFEKLLEDLCTFNEVEQMSQRLFCVKLLFDGLTYNQIIEKVNISSATLSRVSRCFKRGSGGYSEVVRNYCKIKKVSDDEQF